MKWGRKKVWGHLLADPQYQALAACFEELGWKQEDAPAQIAALDTLLSEHVHNKFQLSTQQVDIVVSVTGQGAGLAGRQRRSRRVCVAAACGQQRMVVFRAAPRKTTMCAAAC